MRKLALSLAVLLTCSFFAINAQASSDEHYEHGERYEHDGRYYGGGYSEGRYEESKLYGTVESMPQGSRVGTWRIGGRDVIVTPRTFIKEEYGSIGIGAQVEAKGGGNPFTAYEIEVKSSGRAMGSVPVAPPVMGAMQFYGQVEAMPQTGVVGTWRIGGREVVVTPRTFIKQEYGPLAPGAQVEVKGSGNPFTAYEIEVKGSVIR